MSKKKLSTEEVTGLLKTLKARFDKHPHRHKGIKWEDVQAKLEASPAKLVTLNEMEITEGEPDVVGYDRRRMNICSTIVRPKVPKAAGAFVTMVTRWHPGKNINPKTVPSKWRLRSV